MPWHLLIQHIIVQDQDGQNNNTVFTRLGSLHLFPVSKAEESHERTKICYDRGDKNCIAGRAEDYTKKWLTEVLRRLEEALEQEYYIWGGLLWRGQYRHWWINKYFSRKIKILLIFWTVLVCICMYINFRVCYPHLFM